MKISLKQFVIFAIIAISFSLTSCLTDTEETPSRTEQMEWAEIRLALASIQEQGYTIDSTELGIYYIVDTLGTGQLPVAGDTCYMKYTGFFLDGAIFDDSGFYPQNEGGVWKFIYKENNLIPGFDDGIGLMSKGSRIDMIIPSELAYGPYGSYSVPPYTTLMFAAEMVDLRPLAE
jgi:FKBP-type peptidyl-prolyl cis-trans isomerase FkpA